MTLVCQHWTILYMLEGNWIWGLAQEKASEVAHRAEVINNDTLNPFCSNFWDKQWFTYNHT